MARTLKLRYCNILVARPEHQADELIALLQHHGAKTYHVPTLDILSLETVSVECIAKIPSCTYVIFVSANAVRFGLTLVPELCSHARDTASVYALGITTAQELNKRDIVAEVGADMNSESLLRLPTMQAVHNKRILLVRGMGGRTFLAHALRKLGAEVIELRCYKRVLPQKNIGFFQELLRSDKCDAMIVNSVKALHNAHRMAGTERESLRGLAVCVPADRIANRARQLGHAQVLQARTARAEDTLAALC